jgi:ammonia channel protein AmtB
MLGTGVGGLVGVLLVSVFASSTFGGNREGLDIGAQLKIRLGYDDALDVLGVYGVGGLVGVLLVSVFASSTFGGNQEGLDIGAPFRSAPTTASS